MAIDETKVLYEDNHIIVVIKDENILSQGDITNDENMVDNLKEYLKVKYNKPGNVFVGLVHRLDRRVSGVMVFSKTSKAASRLSESIRSNQFKKKYIAVVDGCLSGSDKLVNKLSKKDGVATIDNKDGKECILYYNVIKNVNNNNHMISVLDIDLITGRYNQIRKQLSIINHPIVGDYKYGYKGINYNDSFGLCCYQISFPHPITKDIMTFEAGFENYFKNI